MRVFVVSALILITSTLANADVRDDSIKAISALRDAGIARKMPDEMQSIDATFAVAEQYLQLDDLKKAEQFYLLTIQKARVLETSLPGLTTTASVPTTDQSLDNQQSAEPSASADHATTTLPAEPPEATPRIQPTVPAKVQSPAAPRIETMPPSAARQTTSEDNSLASTYSITSENLIGNVSTYVVLKNDTLRLVAAKLGVSRQHLAQANHLDSKAFLKIGQKLKYNNRKIVPQRMKNGIVINIPDRTLYYFRQGKLAVSIPVALGVAKKSEKYDWKTPTGKFKVTAKQKDPTWYVPFSIQSEMEEDGKEVITSIPPGSDNPLGKYAIKTSLPGILIHSTTKPGSIYSFASHGCIRVYPEHMEGLFKEILVNTLGEIIYRPVKLAVTEEGRIFMEVHQDAYGKSMGLDAEAKQLIEKQKLSDRVDWRKVKSMLQLKAGIAEDVTL